MAQIVKFKLNGKQSQFDMYYYMGVTGANAQTAIKAPKDAEGNIDLDLTNKIDPLGYRNETQLWLVIRATPGSTLKNSNVPIEPGLGGRYWQFQTNSNAPGGTELRISSTLRWGDGSPTPVNRYTSTVGSDGPPEPEPDAIVHFEMRGDAAKFDAVYSGALSGSSETVISKNVMTSLNLKDLVTTSGDTNRELLFTLKPTAGNQIDSVTCVPVGPFNEYLNRAAWVWRKSGVNWVTEVVNTMASDVDYVMQVATSEIPKEPEPSTKVKLRFIGELSHFDVYYTGGLTGSGLTPVTTGVDVEIDLAGKVAASGYGSDRYLDFRIVPRTGVTVLSVRTSPTPPYNSVLGSRDWTWAKGSLPYLSTSTTIETGSDTLYTVTVESSGPTPEVESPFNKLFNLSREKMEELSNNMGGVWGEATGSSPASSGYLINLMLLPFKLPAEVLGAEETIQIGSVSTRVSAPVVTDDSIELELGTITVADLSGNSLDYQAAKYELMLPFFGEVLELSPSQVVGKPLRITYIIDAYKGMATVNVFNDDSGVPITSATDQVARAIPFKMFSEIANSMDDPVQTNNGLLQATMIVTRQEVQVGEYTNLVQVEGVLGESLGYVEVETIELKGVPDSDRVKSMLQAGVVIR